MASIYFPVFRAKNANGVIVSGAGLWVYQTGTTTPANIFTDDALSIAAENPLESNSAGYFPQFFIAANSRVDLQCRADYDSNTSAPLWQALKIDSLGAEDASTFIRDYGDDGRVQFIGREDRVNLEFGDPSGDDVGGQARIGGWNNTQATDIEIDSAQVDFTGAVDVVGNLAFGGTGPVNKVLASGTATAAATHNIALPAGYDVYELEMVQIATAGSVTVRALFAFDDVPTFKVGAADYVDSGATQVSATPSGFVSTGAAFIRLFSGSASFANAPNWAKLTIITGSARETGIAGDVRYWDSAYGLTVTHANGSTKATSYGRATFIQIGAPADTIAFRYVLRGVRSLG